MSRQIKLSKRTEKKLDKLLEFLEKEWSLKVKNDFIEKLDKSLNHIKLYPSSFPESNTIKGLHKCVITKQTILYYKFSDVDVSIVTLFDSRQDPNALMKELK